MIELVHVQKTYHAGRANAFKAVDDVSLVIPPGQLTVLKGPSGSGKTTLLTLLGCMARPSAGRIRLRGLVPSGLPGADPIEGLDISSLPERFLTQIRRHSFGFIFQQFNLIRGISSLENIMLPAYPTGTDHAIYQARAMELLRLFSMARHAHQPVERLSGGELQRVAIARALINEPSVLIADEPTAHLDRRLSAEFMDLMGSFTTQGKTIIIASHDPIVFEHQGASQVLEMRDGRLLAGSQA